MKERVMNRRKGLYDKCGLAENEPIDERERDAKSNQVIGGLLTIILLRLTTDPRIEF